jgi:hypothetical protein
MATKTRLANKTMWALEDLVSACNDAWAAWRICHDRAKLLMDPVLLAGLSDIAGSLATIERKLRQARAGKYHQ